MTGRVVLITGGNSGIGYEVAKYMCEGGYDVVIGCRDVEKGKMAINNIKKVLPNSLITCMELNLASLSSVREFVKDFVKKKKRLNILINNAGVAMNFKDMTRRTTGDGFELTMATNHLGPFLLTNLLLEYMIQTAKMMGDGRIINITCALHDHENNCTTRSLDFLTPENFQLQKERTYNGLQAYKNSKACNVLFTYWLAEQLKGDEVTVNALDPGVVPTTQLKRHESKLKQTFTVCCIHKVMRPIARMTRSVGEAASQIVDLAINEKFEGKTGKYYKDGVEDRSGVETYDVDTQKTVWKMSARLVGIKSTREDDGFDDISLGC